MSAILLDLFRRMTSRKFWVACASFSIVLLDGLGAAEFSAEVLVIASSGLLAYIGAEATSDAITRYKGNGV